MRREGTGAPLILVDAGPFHRPLVRSLGDDQPVYGLALPRLSDLPRGFAAQDVATNLVQALDNSRLRGPWHLAGWSQAGIIAYEMARQLRARGREVASLILFDTNSPAYLRGFKGLRKAPVRLYFLLEKWLYHFRKMCKLPWREAWRYLRERTGKFQLKARAEEPHTFAWLTQYVAAAGYEPEPCDWPLVLFRSEALQTGWFRDPQLGWGKLARGGLRVYEMAGEHDAMFRQPGVSQLAALLTECIRKEQVRR
jgi:thioesterase domain-containing protein